MAEALHPMSNACPRSTIAEGLQCFELFKQSSIRLNPGWLGASSLRRERTFKIQIQKTLPDTQMATAARLRFFLCWIPTSAPTGPGLGITF